MEELKRPSVTKEYIAAAILKIRAMSVLAVRDMVLCSFIAGVVCAWSKGELSLLCVSDTMAW